MAITAPLAGLLRRCELKTERQQDQENVERMRADNLRATNEAGHGLPDGLYGLVKAIRYNAENGSQDRPLHERLRLIAKDANEAIARLESLALSRGVPTDMALVPRELTTSMAEAAEQEFACGNDFSDAWEAAIATHIFDSGTAPPPGADLSKDSERLDWIERRFSGMTNRELYLPVEIIWGKITAVGTLRQAIDKYMAREV